MSPRTATIFAALLLSSIAAAAGGTTPTTSEYLGTAGNITAVISLIDANGDVVHVTPLLEPPSGINSRVTRNGTSLSRLVTPMEIGEEYIVEVLYGDGEDYTACLVIDGRDPFHARQIPADIGSFNSWVDPVVDNFMNCKGPGANGYVVFDGWRNTANQVFRFKITHAQMSLTAEMFDDLSAVGSIGIVVFPHKPTLVSKGVGGSSRGLGTGVGRSAQSHVGLKEVDPVERAPHGFVLKYMPSRTLRALGYDSYLLRRATPAEITGGDRIWTDKDDGTSFIDFGKPH